MPGLKNQWLTGVGRFSIGIVISIGASIATRAIVIFLKTHKVIDVAELGTDVISCIGFVFAQIGYWQFSMLRAVKEEGVRIATITQVGQAIHTADKEVVRCLSEFLQHLSAATSHDALFDAVLLAELQKLAHTAVEMAHGYLRSMPIEETNVKYMHCLFARSNKRTIINALSFNEQCEWWESPQGKEYYHYNQQALAQGASITRIFIAKDAHDLEQLTSLMARQAEDGFKIKYVLSCDLPDPRLQQNFITFQHLAKLEKGVTWIERAHDKEIAVWNFSVAATKIQETSQVFSRIDSLATDFAAAPPAAAKPRWMTNEQPPE